MTTFQAFKKFGSGNSRIGRQKIGALEFETNQKFPKVKTWIGKHQNDECLSDNWLNVIFKFNDIDNLEFENARMNVIEGILKMRG